MAKGYKVSIIVAVYNAEEFLKESINSVINQTVGFDNIELILVNDGSKDNSLNICNEYAKKYSNIVVINKENEGVSKARNAGIKASTGKYIMFLDSDDTLSLNAVDVLTNYFDAHFDEIDMVTYPLYNIKGEKMYLTPRYNMFGKENNIFDLKETPYLIQPNINIIYKGSLKSYLFDPNLYYSEDEAFNIKILAIKEKIGYCPDAKYYYNKNNQLGVVNTKMNPLYSFDNMIYEYNMLTKEYIDNNKKIPAFIQASILNAFSWRIRGDKLLPYYLKGKEYDQAIEKLKKLINLVDTKIIANCPNMEKYFKIYCLKLKNLELEARLHSNYFELYADNVKIDSLKKIAVVFNKMKHHGNNLEILGAIRSPIFFAIEPKLKAYLILRNKDIKTETIELFKSNLSQYGSKMETAKIYGFNFNIDLRKVRKIYFKVELGDYEYPPFYEFSKYVPFNKKIGYRSYIYKNNIISINDRYLRIKKKTLTDTIKISVKKYLILLKKHKIFTMVNRFLSNFYKKNKEIWLYNDSHGVYDNGYTQFMHDESIKDGVLRYYVYDDELSQIIDKFKGVSNKKLVKSGSLKHKLLYINSSKILSSYNNLSAYCPLYKSSHYYRDLVHYDLIYLQHGILYADLLKMYSNETNEIEKVVISSNFEYNNLINKYNYTENNFIKSGMPRLDFINLDSKPSNKILFAPTWRAHLIGDLINNRREIFPDRFMKSDYYLKINDLINSDELNKVLEENDLVFELKLHPIFKDYVELFKSHFDRIKVSADKIDLDEYKLFITDYSSYIFDFVYLNRPIIYFLPDDPEFKAGLHTYRKLDLPHEDGFGPVTEDADVLIKEIKNVVKNDFKGDSKYNKRMQEFFISRESNHRDTLYNELIKKDNTKIINSKTKKGSN